MEKPLFEKFSVDPETGCWNWRMSRFSSGYGQMWFRGHNMHAHRASAILFMRFDPDSGLSVLHRCDNRACINPKHLFFGTHQDNMEDMKSKNRHRNGPMFKTHCKRGHPLFGDNLFTPKNGQRVCLTCKRQWLRDWRSARKQAS